MVNLIAQTAGGEGIETIKTTCAYCGVGCGIEATVNRHKREVLVAGDFDHPANFGRLCSKGSSLGETIDLSSRLLYPELDGQRVGWDKALDTMAGRFAEVIREHGPDAVAIYVSGQLLTEDYYVVNKLMKGYLGTANLDTNSRLCMSSAVAGHKRAFGTDTVAACYDDIDQADLLVLIGTNTAWCHPIIFQQIRTAKERNPRLKIVVIDPRRTATCDIADLHLPLASGADGKLFNGLLSYLAAQQILDHDFIAGHTDGFAETLAAARADAGDLARVAAYCGLREEDVRTFYQWFRDTPQTVTLYSQGIKQSSSGVDKVNAILNCHLATGRIGKPGAGPLSLTGQPNAMGGREVGGLANQLAAHLEFTVPGDLDLVARFWRAPNMATKAGLQAVDLFDAVAAGKIKALWIMATNPVVSLPNADKVKAALATCDFVVVSDCVAETDTMRFAHLKLPALGWSEKDGTVTNSERRISHQRALLPAAGESRPDWWIITQLARRMGFARDFSYESAVEIFREHAALSGFENNPIQRLRDFDISAFADISAEDYQNLKPIQWPVNKRYPHGKKRFFRDGLFFTPNRRARFIPITARAPVHAPDTQYPLVLNTGRLRDQWHTMTRSALAPRLNQHRPEPFVEVHPLDAMKYSLRHGAIAHLRSQWGQMYGRIVVTDSQRPGDVFVPMHWTEQYATNGRMGAVVNPVVDPISGQPESKHTPVAIRPLAAAWYGFVLSRERLSGLTAEYQVSVNAEGYFRYELASLQALQPPAAWAQALLNPQAQCEWQEYEDVAGGIYRAAAYAPAGALQAVVCIAADCGEAVLPTRAWLGSVFALEQVDAPVRAALLAGVPTVGAEDVGSIVCACFNVGEKTIRRAIVEQGCSTYQLVGNCCKAGTNCGSCVPEIKQLIAATAVAGAA